MVVVPLYDTLGPGSIRYIINTGEPQLHSLLNERQPSPSSLLGHTDRWAFIKGILPLLSENTKILARHSGTCLKLQHLES